MPGSATNQHSPPSRFLDTWVERERGMLRWSSLDALVVSEINIFRRFGNRTCLPERVVVLERSGGSGTFWGVGWGERPRFRGYEGRFEAIHAHLPFHADRIHPLVSAEEFVFFFFIQRPSVTFLSLGAVSPSRVLTVAARSLHRHRHYCPEPCSWAGGRPCPQPNFSNIFNHCFNN